MSVVDGWLVPCPPPTPSPWPDQRWLDDLPRSPRVPHVAEKQDLLVGLARVIARAQAEQLRVLATADDIAEATGDRTTASWLATATRDAHGRVRADATLAAALDQRWTQVADALGRAAVNLAQARVIADALAALPKDLGEDLLAKAETLMLTEANQLGPRELRDLRGPPPGLPGPRHRRRGRLPAAPGPGTPCRRHHPGDPAAPRRRVHRPARPHPRPHRQPAAHLPERLHRPPPPSPDANRRRCVTSPR